MKKRDHGSWYYYLNLPDGPGGERRRPRKGGFPTSKKAQEAAQKLWDEATTASTSTAKRPSPPTSTAGSTNVLTSSAAPARTTASPSTASSSPPSATLTMRELRERHIQEMFKQIWAINTVKKVNRIAAQQAKAECDDAYRAWKQAPRPAPATSTCKGTQPKPPSKEPAPNSTRKLAPPHRESTRTPSPQPSVTQSPKSS
ncbi:Arm DNA-binding domain-containing protein [Streptomyces sp. NPDC054871]